MFIENGRVKDEDNYPLMTGLREIAKVHNGDFRLTANQNLVIGNVSTQKKKKIEELIKEYGLYGWASVLRIAQKLYGLRVSADLRYGDG